MKARLPTIQSSVTLFRGDGASVVLPIRIAPLALVQLMVGIYPEPPAGAPDFEDQESERNRVAMLVRIGYCMTVEGSDYSPSTPFPDWKDATKDSLKAYADALWVEIEEAGFTVSDYRHLITEITKANNEMIEAINRPKG